MAGDYMCCALFLIVLAFYFSLPNATAEGMRANEMPQSYSVIENKKPYPVVVTTPMAPRRVLPPSFPPVISYYPSDAKQPSYLVRYINASGDMVTECLKGRMAKQIPDENIMPSSVNSEGDLCTLCPMQDTEPFSVWPF
jgi:hypothetical protein